MVRVNLLLLAFCVACEAEVLPPEERVEPEVEAEAPPERPVRQEDYLYDEEGNLRPSDTQVVGLTLPRGLDLDYEAERRHVYRTSVPREKLLRYFGPRLFTGAVDAIGDGAIFRAATVRGEDGDTTSSVRLDVSLLPTGARTRVEIFELPPIPANPLPAAELERRYREEMQHSM